MKRNNDLIRDILLIVEQQPVSDTPISIRAGQFVSKFPGLTDDMLNEHIQLLAERGFLEAEPYQLGWFITRLTWDGHDFLANSKEESVWQKTKQVAGNFAFDVFVNILKEAAIQYARALLLGG